MVRNASTLVLHHRRNIESKERLLAIVAQVQRCTFSHSHLLIATGIKTAFRTREKFVFTDYELFLGIRENAI